MTQSKVILTDRTTSPFCAPNTLLLYMRDNILYMKTETQEEIKVTCSASDITEIKTVTDNLPDNGALTSIAQASALTTVDTVVDAIQAVTDNLPDGGALTTISDETDKIDGATTDGLAGTSNSLAYRVHEIERHFHVRERWWGAVAVPDETNAIDANVDTPFVATSGNDDWGTAIPICGTGDNPVLATDVKFDAHTVLVTDTDHATPYRFRVIYGTGTSAAAISAGQWSEGMFITSTGPFSTGLPADGRMPRVDVGVKLWVQVWNATNASTVSFFWGAHGYPG